MGMKVFEILLPKTLKDRSLSPQVASKIDALQARMDRYVDKIFDPNTSAAGKEFLKSKLRDDYHELKDTIGRLHAVAEKQISEAVHKCPITSEDFELIKELMDRPIPAAIAPIYLNEVIIDDELSDQFRAIEETEPSRDVRPLVVEWLNRVMPDQMIRFKGDSSDGRQNRGILSPIHGYDPHMYKGSNDPITGNAYGKF